MEGNDIEYNNTEGINQSIMRIRGDVAEQAASSFGCSPNSFESIRETIFKNVEYDLLCHKRPFDKELLDELVELIVAAVCNQAALQKIGEAQYPSAYVRDKMMRLDASHLEYAMDCLAQTSKKISNIQAYLLTTLFNSPNTINSYYQAAVNHDFNI